MTTALMPLVRTFMGAQSIGARKKAESQLTAYEATHNEMRATLATLLVDLHRIHRLSADPVVRQIAASQIDHLQFLSKETPCS